MAEQLEPLPLAPNANHKLCVIDPDSDIAKGVLCEEVLIEKKVENLDTGEIQVVVCIWVDKREKKFRLDRGVLAQTSALMQELLRQGLSLLPQPELALSIQSYLLDTDAKAPTEYTHHKLGFDQLNGKTVFWADTLIGSKVLCSHYYDPRVTAPAGTPKGWNDGVKQFVLGHPNLELAFAISVAGPVTHLLKQSKAYTENPIIAIIGASSTGKTTALRFMASVFGSPEECVGLIKDLNTTENAFLATLGPNKGLPHLVDESTRKTKWNFGDNIYDFAKGAGKARCETKGNLAARTIFSGVIVVSGERSLFAQSEADLGKYARMIELNLKWTDSDEHARQISETFRQNYGHAVYPLMNKLLLLQEKHPDRLKEVFVRELQKLKDEIGDVPNVGERVCNILATIMVSAWVIRKALKLEVDMKAIRSLLIDLYQAAPKEQDLAEAFYSFVMEKVTAHGSSFPVAEQKGANCELLFNVSGVYAKKDGHSVLWIMKSALDKFVANTEFSNYTPFLAPLYEKGLIERDKSKHYLLRHKVGKSTVKCYCFRVT